MPTITIVLVGILVALVHFVFTGFSDPVASGLVGLAAGWGALVYEVVRTLLKKG